MSIKELMEKGLTQIEIANELGMKWRSVQAEVFKSEKLGVCEAQGESGLRCKRVARVEKNGHKLCAGHVRKESIVISSEPPEVVRYGRKRQIDARKLKMLETEFLLGRSSDEISSACGIPVRTCQTIIRRLPADIKRRGDERRAARIQAKKL